MLPASSTALSISLPATDIKMFCCFKTWFRTAVYRFFSPQAPPGQQAPRTFKQYEAPTAYWKQRWGQGTSRRQTLDESRQAFSSPKESFTWSADGPNDAHGGPELAPCVLLRWPAPLNSLNESPSGAVQGGQVLPLGGFTLYWPGFSFSGEQSSKPGSIFSSHWLPL